jgi:hypothetical protein
MHRTLGGSCRRSTGALMNKDAVARCDRLRDESAVWYGLVFVRLMPER